MSDFKRWVEAFRIVGCPCDETLFSSSVIRDVKGLNEEKKEDDDDVDTYEQNDVEEEKMEFTESKLLLSRRRFGPIVSSSSNAVLEDALGSFVDSAYIQTNENHGDKGWNEKYQSLMEEKGKIIHEVLSAKLYRLQHDMAKSATKHLCKFLENAPMSRHKPKSDFVTRDHLWIRIVGGPFESELDDDDDDDDKEKDEEDEIDVETQRKIVGHELRATEAIQNAMRRLQSSEDNKEHVSVLNQVIVDYLGYRAIVTAIPITQFGDDIEDRTTLNMLASELNVRSETFGQDIVFRQCTDRRYVLHVNYVTPPDNVDEKHDTLKATEQLERCRLRSSLVRAQSRALSMTPYQVPSTDNTTLQYVVFEREARDFTYLRTTLYRSLVSLYTQELRTSFL